LAFLHFQNQFRRSGLRDITHLSLRAGRAATIITNNLTFERCEEVFHDPVLTSALTDRLMHRAHIINMIGGSYLILETKEWMEQSNF